MPLVQPIFLDCSDDLPNKIVRKSSGSFNTHGSPARDETTMQVDGAECSSVPIAVVYNIGSTNPNKQTLPIVLSPCYVANNNKSCMPDLDYIHAVTQNPTRSAYISNELHIFDIFDNLSIFSIFAILLIFFNFYEIFVKIENIVKIEDIVKNRKYRKK